MRFGDLDILGPGGNPAAPRAHVIFAVLGDLGPGHSGKFTNPRRYLQAFCGTLRSRGIAVSAAAFDAVEAQVTHPTTIVVNVVHETGQRREMRGAPIFRDPRIRGVWNSLPVAAALSSKRSCHRLYQQCGAPGLTLADEGSAVRPLFSLPDVGHSSNITRLGEAAALGDPRRFVTEFVDSATEFEGRTYFCSTRLLAAGGMLIGGMVRARPAEEGYSVHLTDTPKDARLLRFLHERHYAPHLGFFRDLARRIADHLGPGFFAHDLIPCARTGRYLICESGLKFQTSTGVHFREIRDDVPHLSTFFGNRFEKLSAEAFLSETARLGWLG